MSEYTKMINGQAVPMTEAEILHRQQDELQWQEASQEKQALAAQAELIQALSNDLSQLFDEQSLELRAQFAPLRAAVKTELELGHVDVARKIIELAEIPEPVEPVRQDMLALFPPTP